MNMKKILPSNLSEAESSIYKCVDEALNDNKISRMSVNLKFEGLKIMPLSLRLFSQLLKGSNQSLLVFPDIGATALARRDSPDFQNHIFSIKELLANEEKLSTTSTLVVVSPQHFDYIELEKLCEIFTSKVILINAKLEDTAVGIGSVGRERRKGFISSWEHIYWLEPLEKGALMKLYNFDWLLFKATPAGYVFHQSFRSKPEPQVIFEILG